MSIIASVYEYENPKHGECTLLQYGDYDISRRNNYRYNYVFQRQNENGLEKLCGFIKNRTMALSQEFIGSSSFYEEDMNYLWLCHISSKIKKVGFATDLLRGIAMYANTHGHKYLNFTALNTAFDFYKKLGIHQVSKKFDRDVGIEIAKYKFADFSKFQLNPKLSQTATEVLK